MVLRNSLRVVRGFWIMPCRIQAVAMARCKSHRPVEKAWELPSISVVSAKDTDRTCLLLHTILVLLGFSTPARNPDL